MSIITKTIKCLNCASFIHKTEQCTIWKDNVFCETDSKYKKYCDCSKCQKKRCMCCNDNISDFRICDYDYDNNNNNNNDDKNTCSKHDGSRCAECNEFLIYEHNSHSVNKMKCMWNHDLPFCKFCNLPVTRKRGYCVNQHYDVSSICLDCDKPLLHKNYKHSHDGTLCKNCGSLLNSGKCIYNCVNGGSYCLNCGYQGILNNRCIRCFVENSGGLTKRATK